MHRFVKYRVGQVSDQGGSFFYPQRYKLGLKLKILALQEKLENLPHFFLMYEVEFCNTNFL